jgi:hypothetical protein
MTPDRTLVVIGAGLAGAKAAEAARAAHFDGSVPLHPPLTDFPVGPTCWPPGSTSSPLPAVAATARLASLGDRRLPRRRQVRRPVMKASRVSHPEWTVP